MGAPRLQKNTETVTVTFKLPEPDLDIIDAIAASAGSTRSAVLRQVAGDLIAERKAS
ncbi:MAG: hypothetical protein ACI8Y4_004690 [Candidatus Poriferisodalaceae bacterium]|jgi:hypothetical protein